MTHGFFFFRLAAILAFLSAASAASTSAFGALTIVRTARWNALNPGGLGASMLGDPHKARVILGGQNAVGKTFSYSLAHEVLESRKV